MAVKISDIAVPERVPLTLLFAETRGFTRVSAMLEPATVLDRMADFFAMITAIVDRHDGVVSNVCNDTVLASFAGPQNAQHAALAAHDIQLEFGRFAEEWERDYGIRTAVAMGLHCGDTVVGVMDSLSPAQRLVIGDAVSVAQRLLHRARAGEYVLSGATMDALAAAQFALEVEELPPLAIAHRESLRVCGVLLDTRLDFT